jgi:hypothetical protein
MRPAVILPGVGLAIVGLGLVAISFFVGKGKGDLDLKFVAKPTLMTAAYKVYGNPQAVGGKYWLGKVTLKNTGSGSLKDMKISYRIPDYLDWTTPVNYSEVLPNQTVVYAIYPRLPGRVTDITSMTNSSLEVKIEYSDGLASKSRVERRDFSFRGVSEIEYSSLPSSEILNYYDMNDNAELNSAWVTEEDPAVRTFYAKIAEKAGGFGTMGNERDITQLARSTYNFMCATGMTYTGTKGLAEKKGDDYVLVQSMRLPRDMIYQNSGLCVELAQLWASIALNSGARCYLVMIPGHCFPVLVATDGTMLPIESTGIGGSFDGGNLGAAISFEDAVKAGIENFNKVRSGQTPFIIVDVLDYRDQGIRPPELKAIDQTAFIRMLDERFASRGGGREQTRGGGTVVRNDTGGGGEVAAKGTAWKDSEGRVSLTYPTTWANQQQFVTQMQQVLPGYALSVADPKTLCGVDVIFFEDEDEADTVAQTIQSVFTQLGVRMQVGKAQKTQVGGSNGSAYAMVATGTNGTTHLVVNVVPCNGGMVAVSVGGPQQNVQAAVKDLEKVLNTVKVKK